MRGGAATTGAIEEAATGRALAVGRAGEETAARAPKFGTAATRVLARGGDPCRLLSETRLLLPPSGDGEDIRIGGGKLWLTENCDATGVRPRRIETPLSLESAARAAGREGAFALPIGEVSAMSGGVITISCWGGDGKNTSLALEMEPVSSPDFLTLVRTPARVRGAARRARDDPEDTDT